MGVGRVFLAVLSEAYNVEKIAEEKRIVMKFPNKLAPVKIAFLPLSKKEELIKPAQELFNEIKNEFVCRYDETQSIGKRYRRQDEIGTPYCVTFDFDSVKNKDITIRNRDTTKQIRVKISELKEIVRKLINCEIEFEKAGKLIS